MIDDETVHRLENATVIAVVLLCGVAAGGRWLMREPWREFCWREYSMRCCVVGAVAIAIGLGVGFDSLALAGALLWAPLYLVVMGGLLWIAEDMCRELLRLRHLMRRRR